MMDVDRDEGGGTGNARHRRERRLRAYLKYARTSVATALAESQHHSAQRQRTARVGRWVREELHGRVPEAPTLQEPGAQHFFLDDDCVPEFGGSRPGRLANVRPQERVPRRIVERIVDSVPVVPLLHAPVPQLVDSVVEVLKIFDNSLPDVEQVIEVPKIILHTVAQRSSLMAEQLVQVPGFEHVYVRRSEGTLCLGVVRAAGYTWFMRVHDTG